MPRGLLFPQDNNKVIPLLESVGYQWRFTLIRSKGGNGLAQGFGSIWRFYVSRSSKTHATQILHGLK